MVPIIFEPREAGPVLGWTSTVAAYGAFIIPRVFGQQVSAGTPEFALYGFAFYYFTCLVLKCSKKRRDSMLKVYRCLTSLRYATKDEVRTPE